MDDLANPVPYQHQMLRTPDLTVMTLSESQETEIKEKIQEHMRNMNNILKDFMEEGRIVKVLRAGKEGNDQRRPIKLITDSRNTVLRILRNKNEIIQGETKINQDFTVNQTANMRRLQTEVKERNERGENLTSYVLIKP